MSQTKQTAGAGVVISAEGVFVPASLFDAPDSLRAEVRNGSSGTEVVVSSRPSPAQATENQRDAGHRASHDWPEMKWLQEHRLEYQGKWVAIHGDQLIAAGPDAAEVFRKAHEAGIDVPFVEYIEVEPQLPYMGW